MRTESIARRARALCYLRASSRLHESLEMQSSGLQKDGSRGTRRSAFLSLGNNSDEYAAGERRVVNVKQRVRILIRGMRAKQGGQVASEMK